MSYALYTLSDDARTKFPNKRLELTLPLVLFGIFRYLYLVHRREGRNGRSTFSWGWGFTPRPFCATMSKIAKVRNTIW
jgi:hypothetical protein